MITKAYSLFDVKAAVYGVPFFMHTRGLAIRAFTDLVNDPKSTPYKYPADFTLFEVGEFDDVNGFFKVAVSPVPVGKGTDFQSVIKSEVKS